MDYLFEYRAIAEALYDALTEDAFYMAMESSVAGGPDQRREAMLRYYDYSMREAREYGHLYLPSGKAFGISIWSKPVNADLSRQVSNQKKAFLGKYMGYASLSKYREITEFMAEQTAPVVPPDSWYLSIVGIAPAFQGGGLGGSLIRPILNRTDELGSHTFLETFTPRNIHFYERLGFKDTAGFLEPATGVEYRVMIREPS